LIAKTVFGAKIKIAFTSTAQRHHSRFSRWLMRRMDAIISTCSEAASYLVERAPDIIVPHGVDITTYVPAESRQVAWRETRLPGQFGIGIFGRVRYSKGIDILVDALIPLLPQYPGLTVVICGECAPKDQAFLRQLQASIAQAQLSDRFVFLGKQPFSALPKLFQSMSLVAALSREEGFGLTPLEAMASGTAVITSQAGVWPDIIRNGIDGYCLSTHNISDVRAVFDSMLADLDKTHEMGRVAREYMAKEYSVSREAKQLTQFLKTLVAPATEN
jgi:mannosyltransferase